ncbi:Mucin-like protein [Phytophthora cinnamomi]|uniref:Mucin-like protein n=1 Tax=Phytophthora cinnamomi TaxID=4785 RepID=UPI00355A94BB|nr:Mucin-like protein [Phytophthora cinnamomi]
MNQLGSESADSDSAHGSDEMTPFTDDLDSGSSDVSSSGSDYGSDSSHNSGSKHSDASDHSELGYYSGSGFSTSYSDSGFVDCTDISVGDDATFCIPDQICSGEGDAPTGYACPLKDDVAVDNCQDGMRSFLGGECVAPRDSVCQKIASGPWGCVWDDEVVSPTATSNAGVTTTTGNEEEVSAASCNGTMMTAENMCSNVRIDGDATYCVTGAVCSGNGDSPTGDRCPVPGDVAVGDCHNYFASYSNGKCVAKSDAVCKRASTGTWGCVWSASDSAASYTVDTSSGNTPGTSSGSDQALGTGIAAAAAVAAVVAGIAVAWSRHKRQNQHRRYTEERIGMALTPPGSMRSGSFHRV